MECSFSVITQKPRAHFPKENRTADWPRQLPSGMASTQEEVPSVETEAKVQVDRRRLEAMITGDSPGETADAFFARVERTTGTRICWPSRLKIKAKTRKDPFVKLLGSEEGVRRAAEMIGARLRVKREKTTLKMEISHCLHSQIIGRGGRNTQQIMRDTGCHIHFPDSNKLLGATVAGQAKNDQVSISGAAKDVERAREMLRAIGPLAVSVNIQLELNRSNMAAIQSRLDPGQLQRHFPQQSANAANGDVEVQFSQGPAPPGALHFVMRTSGRNELDMLRQFGRICQLIGVFPSGNELFCCSQFEIRASALPALSAVRWIAFRTNTQIQLNGQGLLVSGPLEGIFVARKFMTGLLPVALHFEKPTEVGSQEASTLRSMERELDVQIVEKRRRKAAKPGCNGNPMEEHEFVVSTYEVNLFNAYLARNRLLQLNESSAIAGNMGGDEEEEQFPQDTDQAALMRSLCRQSLLADQQPALPASMPFPTCRTPPFPMQSTDGMDAMDLVDLEAPKSPDPEESPIAAGLLAGAKSINLEKGDFRRALDRERMQLKASQAIYGNATASLLDPLGSQQKEGERGAPTDFWAGYGFSSSLPAELLRVGRLNSVGFWADNEAVGKPKGRPIVGRAPEDDLASDRKEKELPPIPTQNADPNANCFNTSLGKQIPEEASHSAEPKKATALVHPRVAALQAGEQRKPKFTMSTGSGLFEGTNFPREAFRGEIGTEFVAPQPPPCPQWDIRVLTDPSAVLAQLGLAEHVPLFRQQEVDMQAFLLLDEACLQSLGVTTLGARRKIMHAVAKLRDSAHRHGLYSL